MNTRQTLLQLLYALGLAALLGALGEFMLHQESQQQIGELEKELTSKAGEVRAMLINELNGTLHLASGLASYIEARDGHIAEDELAPWVTALIAQGKHIRNIGLAPGNRISYIYPLAGNAAAMGLYYPDIPAQWASVQRAMQTRKALLDGPITLKQGGMGLIYRVPVYLADGSYWGIISTVIDANALLADVSTLAQAKQLQLHLSAQQGSEQQQMILGSAQALEQSRVRLDIPVPGGQWLLAASSTAPTSGSMLHWLRLGTWLLALLFGGLLWQVQRAAQRQAAAELALSTTRLRFSRAFTTAPQGMALVSPEGHWLEINQQFCNLLGRSAAELKAADAPSVLGEEDRQQLHQARQAPCQWESRLSNAAGSPIDCLLSASWLDDSPPCLILQCQDISARKHLEQLKSEFVSTVSHELRTPLTAINGALGLIIGGAMGEVPASMQGMLQMALENGQRLNLLVNDLLDMDKLLAGKMNFSLREQPLQPLLEQALASNQNYASQFQVRLSQSQPTDAWIRVDELRLQQVLANYLSNAAKFSPPGAAVELFSSCADGWVRVSVRDQGPGIDDEFRPRIFQKFAQADGSDTRQKGGTGLGLAICKELIERMGGRLGFDSVAGQGATFWFELPLIEARKGSATPANPG